MSYDIRFGVKVAGAPDDCFAVIGHPERDSPTYNIGNLFRACMDWNFKQGEWYKLTDIYPKICHGIQELTMHSKKYKEYEPDNGWGDVGSALECLQSIRSWVEDEMQWSWNSEVPKDCIYMAW